MLMNHSAQRTFFCRSKFDAPNIGLFQLIEGYSVVGKTPPTEFVRHIPWWSHEEKPASCIINLCRKTKHNMDFSQPVLAHPPKRPSAPSLTLSTKHRQNHRNQQNLTFVSTASSMAPSCRAICGRISQNFTTVNIKPPGITYRSSPIKAATLCSSPSPMLVVCAISRRFATPWC